MTRTLSFAKTTVALAAVALMLTQCANKKNNQDGAQFDSSLTKGKLPIAYVNVDTLLANYQFAKDANEELVKGQEDSRLKINSRAKQLQEDMATFESKMKNNAFLSRERAEQENNRLVAQQKELQELNQQLSNALLTKQQKFNEQLRDTVNKFLKGYAPAHHYQVVLSTNAMNDNVLYAADGYDITKEVLQQLNTRYTKKK
ncbi:OmpH family outer membrane protein [Paludibacter sp.]|uniref:OmpH family outer membrane protein n=1 Tax=Paludibacter sp. TaxID=1898105 RepID=UPI0013544EBE|nr:OmpH family outer membrane protein [Paludibacter sp.]MTK51926.1 OmpH family outer membrane protein [Paludibacter sp.]